MSSQKITREEYLDKNFDYTKLTKQELRQIMSENNIEDIPPITALKSTILEVYKKTIHDNIDTIQGNFSTENIFQKEKRKRKDESFIDDSVNKSTTNASRSFIDTSSFLDNTSISQSKNRVDSSSIAAESSEINSTAFSHKQKIPFISIPKRKPDAPNKQIKKCFLSCKRISMIILLAVTVYFKFFCPYCKPGMNFCIPVPPHSTVINNQLVCNEGYRMFRGICDICVLDTNHENEIIRKVNGYVRMLEYLKGDFKYGFAKSPKMRKTVITDSTVMKMLHNLPAVIISDEWIEAKNSRISLKILVKFYSIFLIKAFMALVAFIIMIKIVINRRRKASILKTQATAVSKEILDILNRQIIMSVRSSQFKPHVLAQQMRDALDIKEDVWKFVEEIIKKNSNVEKTLDEQGRTTWRWIGPVLYKSESIDVQ